jgi:hypothetical protein
MLPTSLERSRYCLPGAQRGQGVAPPGARKGLNSKNPQLCHVKVQRDLRVLPNWKQDVTGVFYSIVIQRGLCVCINIQIISNYTMYLIILFATADTTLIYCEEQNRYTLYLQGLYLSSFPCNLLQCYQVSPHSALMHNTSPGLYPSIMGLSTQSSRP